MDKENNVISLAEDASEVFEAYLKSGHGAMFSMYASKAYKEGKVLPVAGICVVR